MSKIGLEQTPEDQEDGPPELLFVHGGHTSRPTDISWNMNEEWTLATAAEDNILQVWRPSASLYSTDDIVVDAEDLE